MGSKVNKTSGTLPAGPEYTPRAADSVAEPDIAQGSGGTVAADVSKSENLMTSECVRVSDDASGSVTSVAEYGAWSEVLSGTTGA